MRPRRPAMDELDAVRELRADAPALDTAGEVGGRWTLMAAIVAETELDGTARGRRNWFPQRAGLRPVIAAAAALAVSAGILVALPNKDTGNTDTPRTLATVLAAAAAYADTQEAQRPEPDQWILSDRVTCQLGCSLQPSWVRGDGKKIAHEEYSYGKWSLVTNECPFYPTGTVKDGPIAAYDILAKLPTEPHALLKEVATNPALSMDMRPAPGALESGDFVFRLIGDACIENPKPAPWHPPTS